MEGFDEEEKRPSHREPGCGLVASRAFDLVDVLLAVRARRGSALLLATLSLRRRFRPSRDSSLGPAALAEDDCEGFDSFLQEGLGLLRGLEEAGEEEAKEGEEFAGAGGGGAVGDDGEEELYSVVGREGLGVSEGGSEARGRLGVRLGEAGEEDVGLVVRLVDESFACGRETRSAQSLLSLRRQLLTLFSLVGASNPSDISDIDRLHLESLDELEEVVRHRQPSRFVAPRQEDRREGSKGLEDERLGVRAEEPLPGVLHRAPDRLVVARVDEHLEEGGDEEGEPVARREEAPEPRRCQHAEAEDEAYEVRVVSVDEEDPVDAVKEDREFFSRVEVATEPLKDLEEREKPRPRDEC